MRIVHVCPRYYPYPGGLERVVKNIADGLALMNHDVTVYATDPLISFPRSQKIGNVRVNYYPSLARKDAYFLPHFSMFIDLLREDADILHVNNIQVLTTPVAFLANRFRPKSRLVLSPYYHGRGHTELAEMLWIPYRSFAKNIMRNVDAVVVNSDSERSLVESRFGTLSRVYRVYDGVDLHKIGNAEPYKLDGQPRILLYVGRLEKYKNIHLTIKALKSLPKNYYFYIIGQGPYRSMLENLVRSLSLSDRVHFLGFQSDKVVYRWMKTADVFLHLSAVESFGMTCIESLGAGTPVIVNEDGLGLSETMNLYPTAVLGYRVEKDPGSKLLSLIEKAVNLKPINVNVSSFSWDAITKSVSKVYEEIIRS